MGFRVTCKFKCFYYDLREGGSLSGGRIVSVTIEIPYTELSVLSFSDLLAVSADILSIGISRMWHFSESIYVWN